MFVTEADVLAMTGIEPSYEVILQAQVILEAYTGRTESQVDDPNDMMMLARATAYQAAYISSNPSRVFEQVSATMLSQMGQTMTFTQDGVAPFIAPLAVLACKNLSWRRSHSIRTGPAMHEPRTEDTWETT